MVRKAPKTHGHKHDIRVRLSDREHDAVAAAAARHGVTISSYLRTLILEHTATGKPPGILASSLADLSRQLSGIGNNLNQIAHAINAGKTAPVSQILSDVQAANSETRYLLREVRI